MARKKKKQGITLEQALRMVSPGTKIREAISAILQSHNGALICVGDPKELADLSEGGVAIGATYTPQMLYELAKMDGAILLDEEAKRIEYANRFLKTDFSIPSDETGARHRAAERIAVQARCLVIALSERRGSVCLYVQDTKHMLATIPTLLNKASQAMQTLDKYMQVLDDALTVLSTREFEDMVTIFDVCRAIQRCEMVVRIGAEIQPHIMELGTEGRLLEMQLDELMMPVEEAKLVSRDYYRERAGLKQSQVEKRISEIDQQALLKPASICQALGYGSNLKTIDTYLSPRGYRILSQTRRLSPQVIENLVSRFGSLGQIMRAPKEDLCQVDGIGDILAERVRASLNSLRSQLALDRGRR